MLDLKLFQKKFDQKRRDGVTAWSTGANGCGSTFGFESLIPNPYRRDQPAQRLRFNFWIWKPYPQSLSAWSTGATVAVQRLRFNGCGKCPQAWGMSEEVFRM